MTNFAFGIFLVGLVAAIGATLQPSGGRVAGDGPGGFTSEIVLSGISEPTDFAFAPDGRIFISTLRGTVRIVENEILLPEPFIELDSAEFGERGLMSIALDPDFSTNGFVYYYNTLQGDPADLWGPKTSQVVRVTANGNLALPGSEQVLIGSVIGTVTQPSCQDFPVGADCIPADGFSHIGGGLRFAPDGKLFLATGDAALLLTGPDEGLMGRVQDLDSLAGKLLRIYSDGSVPTDNPFYTGDPQDNRSKIWSYGLRQGFRMGIHPLTGQPFIGDVGSSYRDEIDVGSAGANFGWPCYEGVNQHPTQKTFALCQQMYSTEVEVSHPLYDYIRGSGATVVGGVFYPGGAYPPEFEGAYFFGDWLRESITALAVDGSGHLITDSVQSVLSAAGNPMALGIGPGGDVYYLTWSGSGNGELRRLVYLEGNRPPSAHASAAPLGGLAPLAVQFSASASSDPDDDEISYAWDFGDGATSEQPNPSHVYSQSETYEASLTVTDTGGLVATSYLTVVVGNQVPAAAITSPLDRNLYESGQAVAYTGIGTDPEDGTLAGGQLHWIVTLHHCIPSTVTCHAHPMADITGGGGSVVGPAQSDEIYFLQFSLTVTDSVGLQHTVSTHAGQDSDEDGLLDFEELLTTGTEYLDADTDDNGTQDGDEDTDTDGCTNLQEFGTDEKQGGRRDPGRHWDYFNPTHDGLNRVDDILAVIEQYFVDSGQPGYNPETDRTLIGPQSWDLGPPDGLQRIDDVLSILKQYFHDCT